MYGSNILGYAGCSVFSLVCSASKNTQLSPFSENRRLLFVEGLEFLRVLLWRCLWRCSTATRCWWCTFGWRRICIFRLCRSWVLGVLLRRGRWGCKEGRRGDGGREELGKVTRVWNVWRRGAFRCYGVELGFLKNELESGAKKWLRTFMWTYSLHCFRSLSFLFQHSPEFLLRPRYTPKVLELPLKIRLQISGVIFSVVLFPPTAECYWKVVSV